MEKDLISIELEYFSSLKESAFWRTPLLISTVAALYLKRWERRLSPFSSLMDAASYTLEAIRKTALAVIGSWGRFSPRKTYSSSLSGRSDTM